jgi:hypothetical protein
MKLLVQKNLVEGLMFRSQNNLNFCKGCVFGKQHREPFSTSRASRTNKLQGLVHFDVWGLAKIPSSGGAKYFLTFINNIFRIFFCYFLKNKGECFTKFQEFKAFVESQNGNKIKVLRLIMVVSSHQKLSNLFL